LCIGTSCRRLCAPGAEDQPHGLGLDGVDLQGLLDVVIALLGSLDDAVADRRPRAVPEALAGVLLHGPQRVLGKFLTKQWQIGLVGYFYNKLSCDSGPGDKVACFESRVAGIGPQIGYSFPLGDIMSYLNLKAYPLRPPTLGTRFGCTPLRRSPIVQLLT
jgi:hypothetical protein